MKLVNETCKILNDDTIKVTATAVRVPVMGGHSESVNIEFKQDYDLNALRELLAHSEGLIVQDNPAQDLYPMAITANEKDEVFVGRIRGDFSQPNSLNLWIVFFPTTCAKVPPRMPCKLQNTYANVNSADP